MRLINFLFAICFLFVLSSCEAIAGIFKAGFNVGVFVVILVIVLILVGMFKMFGGSKK
ncbi:hypothetical protein [Emticicia sp. 17c]|uniref:hypothetical protein n=1 Tax=Emticicia sp. 17c TaxID=3127704 RepID=UPI00301C917E